MLVADGGEEEAGAVPHRSASRAAGRRAPHRAHVPRRVTSRRCPRASRWCSDAAPEPGWSVDAVVPDEADRHARVRAAAQRGHRVIADGHRRGEHRAARGRRLVGSHGLGDAGIPARRRPGRERSSDAAGGREAGGGTAGLADGADRNHLLQRSDRDGRHAGRRPARAGVRGPLHRGHRRPAPVADALDPGLTTVALPHAEMGGWGMARLLSRVEGPDEERPGRLQLMPGWLVERGSVAAAALLRQALSLRAPSQRGRDARAGDRRGTIDLHAGPRAAAAAAARVGGASLTMLRLAAPSSTKTSIEPTSTMMSSRTTRPGGAATRCGRTDGRPASRRRWHRHPARRTRCRWRSRSRPS